MSDNLIAGIALILVGALLGAIGAFVLIRTRIFMSKAQEVPGTVVRLVYTRSSDGGGYSPVYQFKTIDGQMIEVMDSLSSNPPMFKEGQVISVLYDPENPQRPRIKKWISLYFVPVLMGGLALIFGVIGIWLLISQVVDLLK